MAQNWLTLAGAIFHSMEDRDFVLAVSQGVMSVARGNADCGNPEDFGLMLASCGAVRVIQEFPNMKLTKGTTIEEPGTERQHLTLTLSNAEGCKVLLE